VSARQPHDRYWPRDAPVRWRWLARRLLLWGVALLSAVAQLALAVVDISVIENGTVSGISAWILSASWIGLAVFVVWNWWFFRWRIVLGPIGGAAILWLLTTTSTWPRTFVLFGVKVR
jgi:hypothetical protein